MIPVFQLPSYQITHLPNSSSPNSSSLLFFEVCILKNIRRGANQAETHFGGAGIAGGESVAVEHHNFVSASVRAIMDNLINPGLAYRFTRAEDWAGTGALFVRRMQARLPALFGFGRSAACRPFPERGCLILSLHGHQHLHRMNNKPICIALSWTATQLFFYRGLNPTYKRNPPGLGPI